MPERDRLDRRLHAVERALTGGDHDLDTLARSGDFARRLDEVENRLHDIEERLDELDAATQAVRGYVGNVRSVNEDVAQRADAALAAVDRLEDRLDADEQPHRRATESGRDRSGTAERTRQPSSTVDERATGRTDRRQRADEHASVDQRETDERRAREPTADGEDGPGRTESGDGSVLDRIRTRL